MPVWSESHDSRDTGESLVVFAAGKPNGSIGDFNGGGNGGSVSYYGRGGVSGGRRGSRGYKGGRGLFRKLKTGLAE